MQIHFLKFNRNYEIEREIRQFLSNVILTFKNWQIFSIFQQKNIEYEYDNTLRIPHQLNIQTGWLKENHEENYQNKNIQSTRVDGVFFLTNVCILCDCGMQKEKKTNQFQWLSKYAE